MPNTALEIDAPAERSRTFDTRGTVAASNSPTPGACPHCGFYRGHGAMCRTRLVRREGRVAYAAHIFASYGFDREYMMRLCEAAAAKADVDFTENEYQEAMALAEAQEYEYQSWRVRYGSPEYGGWAIDRRDGRRKPVELIGGTEIA